MCCTLLQVIFRRRFHIHDEPSILEIFYRPTKNPNFIILSDMKITIMEILTRTVRHSILTCLSSVLKLLINNIFVALIRSFSDAASRSSSFGLRNLSKLRLFKQTAG